MHTPTAPGAHPCPWACHTACRMHLRTPSRLRSARPRWSRLQGTEYWMFLFSQPPPFRISLISMSSRSEEHTSELQSRSDLVCRLLLEKKKKNKYIRV